MMKKILALALSAAMAFSLAACSGSSSESTASTASGAASSAASGQSAGVAKEDLKVGVILIGDENEGYSLAHINGIQEMKENLGLTDDQIIIKYNIPEGDECYEAAVDLAEQGCQIVFGNSFGFEGYMIQAAEEYPEVEFCHATGYQAASSGLPNMHNYFTSVYESRYVSGVVAGMKLNEMIADGQLTEADCKLGYVGAYSYAEVKSGYTAFFLGVRSVCPSATMEVKYTGSWADQALEKETAEALIADGCVLISQHADTTGAATACEAAGVPNVGYNISMLDAAPNWALTSASINWAPYYTYATQCMLDGETIVTDWCQGYSEGADRITELNEKAFKDIEAVKAKVAETEAAIIDGSLKVFDTSTWTVGGETITTTATEELAETYYGNEYIIDGAFAESTLASAPAFAFVIDGITELNQVF